MAPYVYVCNCLPVKTTRDRLPFHWAATVRCCDRSHSVYLKVMLIATGDAYWGVLSFDRGGLGPGRGGAIWEEDCAIFCFLIEGINGLTYLFKSQKCGYFIIFFLGWFIFIYLFSLVNNYRGKSTPATGATGTQTKHWCVNSISANSLLFQKLFEKKIKKIINNKKQKLN